MKTIALFSEARIIGAVVRVWCPNEVSYKKSGHLYRGALPANTTDMNALTFFMGKRYET